MQSFEAIIDPDGNVRLVTPITVDKPMRAIVTIVDHETAILSEPALADWSKRKEDEAWAHLQPDKSSS